MSRSYKRTPRAGDRKKAMCKRAANRRVRKQQAALQNNLYKKYYNSWDICDYESVHTTFEDYCKFRIKLYKIVNKEPPSKRQMWQEYQRMFIRK